PRAPPASRALPSLPGRLPRRLRLCPGRVHLRPRSLVVHDWPHLNAASWPRDALRPGERVIEVLAVEQVVAAELLLSLGERAVRDYVVARLLDLHGGSGGGRLQALAAQVHPSLPR